jgi:hypothetical protein
MCFADLPFNSWRSLLVSMVVVEKPFPKLGNPFLVSVSMGLRVGSGTIDSGVSKNGDVFWDPPANKGQAKQRQVQQCSTTGLFRDSSAPALDLPTLLDTACGNNPYTK